MREELYAQCFDELIRQVRAPSRRSELPPAREEEGRAGSSFPGGLPPSATPRAPAGARAEAGGRGGRGRGGLGGAGG